MINLSFQNFFFIFNFIICDSIELIIPLNRDNK